MKLLILSDIHGNLEAYKRVLADIDNSEMIIDGCIILGDLIDYGMHSNEVIELTKNIKYPLLCNIWGNHEFSIINDCYEQFSGQRGVESAIQTRDSLTDESISYITDQMISTGKYEFLIDNKRCLAIHGSLDYGKRNNSHTDIDCKYWISITPDVDATLYSMYDFVFSGHSHIPHYFEKFVSIDDPCMRDRKKICFINPGSVGQPRNHIPLAQYVVFDTESEDIVMRKKEYDIKKEQDAYNGEKDDFYKIRLEHGI